MSLIGLIVGAGHLPRQIIKETSDCTFVAVCFDDANAAWLKENEIPYISPPLGHIGESINFFKQHNATTVVLAGSIRRPNLFDLKLDNLGKQWLKEIGLSVFKGDDGFLSSILKLLEKEGFQVISAKELLTSLSLKKGVRTLEKPSNEEEIDIKKGIEILDALSPFDIGQSIIIENGLVLGIEGAEGTEQLIKRISSYKKTPNNGILIKKAKLNQSNKADLPTIGPDTILQCFESGLRGLAIEAKGTQVLDKEIVIRTANSKGLFLRVF